MIVDLFFLLCWILFPLIWHYLLKIAGINLKFFSIPALLILFIYLFQYIGFPILYFQVDEYRAYFVTDTDLVLTAFFYTSVAITLLIIGFIIARQNHGELVWTLDPISLQADLVTNKSRYAFISVALLMMGSSILFIYLDKVGYENIALLAVIGDSDLSSQELRSNMGNNFDGKYHWYSFGMRDILIYLSLSLYAYLLISKNNHLRNTFIVTLLITSFSLIVATEKAPLVKFFIMLFFCHSVISNNKKILSFISMAKVALVVFSIQIIFYLNFMHSDSVWDSFISALSRIFTGQMQPIYHYLEIFPERIEFLGGRSFPNPGGLFPFENFRLTVEIMNIIKPNLESEGIVGSMPTIFWGEAYANFGFLGVVFVPVIIGYFTYLINSLLYKLKPNPFSIALFIYTAEYISRLSGTGFSGYLFNIPLILMIILSFSVLFFVYNGRIELNTKKPHSA